MSRLADLGRLYAILDRLEKQSGGKRTLDACIKDRELPFRGVYFFFENKELRSESGEGPRVVRVGTHALNAGSRSTLRKRLAQHRGTTAGGGNHRGSIFRLLVGQALQARGDVPRCVSWGVKTDIGKAALALGSSGAALAAAEAPVEAAVTNYLRTMRLLYIAIDDDPGPESLRLTVERNAIALLSNFQGPSVDEASPRWLGRLSDRVHVCRSGLWNQRHVEEKYDPTFLDIVEKMMGQPIQQPSGFSRHL